MFTYGSFQKANNKGPDQTVWMRRVVCVVCKTPKAGFLTMGSIYELSPFALRLAKTPVGLANQSAGG